MDNLPTTVSGDIHPAPTQTSRPIPSTLTPAPAAQTSVPPASPSPTFSPTSEVSCHLCSPLAEHEISELSEIVSDPYDPPPPGKDDRHQGVDFAYYRRGERASIEGEGVMAILPGRVASSMNNRLPYGNMLIIETSRSDLPPGIIHAVDIDPGQSLYHLYAHLAAPPQVTVGDWVACGQLLGEVGKTGYNIPIPHLHLETRIGPADSVFESMVFYDTRATEDEMYNYRWWRMSGEFRHFDPMILFDE
ncbi:MAG: M23 family metallopeptidase [Chloroflexota bacterium]